MAQVAKARLLATPSQWAAIAVAAVLGIAVFTFVDFEPRVEPDFFFSTDDPQLRTSLRIEEEFRAAPQVFIAVRAPHIISRSYLLSVRELTDDLQRIPGVADVRSTANALEEPEDIPEEDPEDVFEDVIDSPFWGRLLLAPDRSATLVVLRLAEDADHKRTVHAIDRVLARHDDATLDLGASGVPYVVEHIRWQLASDLQRFSGAALVAFAIIMALLFRSAAVVLGAMVAALTACFATFLVRSLLGMHTNVLSPNIWTIAFVLTLSHMVYLTAEWRRQARELGAAGAARSAIGLTAPASFWSLAANLLGFGSLIFVSAKPLREFGMSGGIAAIMALACAYWFYPPFLRAAHPPTGAQGPVARRLEHFFTTPHPVAAGLFLVAVLAIGTFSSGLDTDPTLPSYFASGSAIRTGLEAIDRSVGSSPLDVVIEDASKAGLGDGEQFERLLALQRGLETHPDVGSVLSVALLMAETKRPWYSFLFSWEKRLEFLDTPKAGRIGRAFMSEDRRWGRFILRMKEGARSRPRAQVIREIEAIVRRHGFAPVMVGGLYRLQGDLATLVEASVIRGLGGLIALFFLIVLIVTRSLVSALTMSLCLAIIPFTLFGLVTLARMPVDIISAPAANVALPLGIDEMIHLGHRVRRLRERVGHGWAVWRKVLAELWAPILASMLIVSSGFALFLLSSFPPTRRLGVLVCIGALLTDVVVLIVLPGIVAPVVTWSERRFGKKIPKKV